jgi:hypothetical protein
MILELLLALKTLKSGSAACGNWLWGATTWSLDARPAWLLSCKLSMFSICVCASEINLDKVIMSEERALTVPLVY